MHPRRYLPLFGLVVALIGAAPTALAAPAAQQVAIPAVSPALAAAMLQGIQQIFPADVFQQVQPRLVALGNDTYLVSHPALYWRVEEEPAAQALAGRLASLAPGWSTLVFDGPQGRGVYLTYHHG